MARKTIIVRGLGVAVVLALGLFGSSLFTDSQKAQIVNLYTVNTTSDTVVPNACANVGAGCSLRGAIEAANASVGDDAIIFAIPVSDPSCSAGVCTINLTQLLPHIDVSVSITGPGPDKLTIRPATGVNIPVILIRTPGTVTISGLTISHGRGSSLAGGIAINTSGIVNVTNCVISNNAGLLGAGIFHQVGTMNISNTTINGNQGARGAGIYNNSGTLNLINSKVSGNSAVRGGGIYVSTGTVNVTSSTISGNEADEGGGAYSGDNGTFLKVTNSTISGNHAVNGGKGGGIFHANGILHLTNSTISDNTASSVSGGIHNASGGVSISHSTITRNSAPNIGGISSAGDAFVRSTIIARNTNTMLGQPDVGGNFVSVAYNLIGASDGSTGFTHATDQTGTIAAPLDPKLDPMGLQNNGGPTATIALHIGSPAIDKGAITAIHENLTTDQRGTGFPRAFDDPLVPNAAGGNGTDIGALERRKAPYDFDGDGRTDIGIFRPAPGEWWYRRSADGVVPAFQFGAATDRIVPADYTGDGKTDVAIWRPSSGEWFILRSENLSFFSFPFGASGDVPAPADYDADGKADPAVFRPSTATWFIQRSSDNQTQIVGFGANGDVPVPADYDGDGRSDIAIFRVSNGQWWINRSTAGVIVVTFGNSSDKQVQGDYTGDGKSDVAFWRPSTGEWFILRSEDLSFFSFPFGTTSDIPAAGDYDGDGKFDATVFRPSSATWYSQRTSAGTLIQQFGADGDRPIPNAFVP